MTCLARSAWAHPFAAHEQRGRDMLAPQEIDGVRVVARGGCCQFAEIKCQCHGLHTLRQHHPPNAPLFLRRQGRQLHTRQTSFRWGAVVGQGTPLIGGRGLPEMFKSVCILNVGWLIGPAPDRQRRQTAGHNDAEDKAIKPDFGIRHECSLFRRLNCRPYKKTGSRKNATACVHDWCARQESNLRPTA